MKNGFSLIELTIVIGIIVILAAASVPVIAKIMPSFRMSSSVQNVLTNLRQAQEEAITVQKQHSLQFNLSADPIKYQIINIDAPDPAIKNLELPKSVTITFNPPAANNEVIFSSDGGPNWTGDITVKLNGKNKIINVSPGGVIKVP